MKLHILSVFVLDCVIRIYGQDEGNEPPLPAPNRELVDDFRVALEAVSGIDPVSAAAAVGQLILGAEGDFRKQLIKLLAISNSHRYEKDTISYDKQTHLLPYATLHLQLSSLLKTLQAEQDASKHFLMKEESVLLVKNATALKNTFRRSITRLYETRDYPMDFEEGPSRRRLWDIISLIGPNTYGLFDYLLYYAPLALNTSSIFINAISFKAQWKIPFDAQSTRRGSFKSATRDFTVRYMLQQLEQIPYAESSDYRIIGIPYANEELGMYIILPKSKSSYKYDLKGFLQSVKYREVLDTISKANRRNVVVRIPKMELSTVFSFLDKHKKHRIFDQLDKIEEKVDIVGNVFLANAAVGESLHVDDIIQNVRVSFDEGGSEGSAVSAVTPTDYMGRAENFNVERPFIFFIRHEATSATLFWGAITDPRALNRKGRA